MFGIYNARAFSNDTESLTIMFCTFNKPETTIKATRPREIENTRPPNLTWPHTALTFDLKTLKVDCFVPMDHLWQLTSKSVHSFSQFVHNFGNRRTNGMDESTNERNVENNIPPPASPAWRRYKIVRYQFGTVDRLCYFLRLEPHWSTPRQCPSSRRQWR